MGGLVSILNGGRESAPAETARAARRVALIGGANVGKSCLFTALTGRYVAVSNYPGTTVEISRAAAEADGVALEVIDTPGIAALRALREDERVTQRLLLEEAPDLVVHVVRASQLTRGIAMTCELLEAGFPTVLVLNMLDELGRMHLSVDTAALAAALGIPVCGTVATTGEGLDGLRRALAGPLPAADAPGVAYPEPIARFLDGHAGPLAGLGIGPRAAGLLLLEGDPGMEARAAAAAPGLATGAARVRETAGAGCASLLPAAHAGGPGCGGCPFSAGGIGIVVATARREWAASVAAKGLRQAPGAAPPPSGRLDRVLLHPVGGYLVLAALLFGFYEIVGVFGAGVAVDWMQTEVFGARLNPWVTRLVESAVPWEWARGLAVGPNGIWTLALTYAFSIIVPVVGLFYLCFGVLEDTGYLPRLGVLLHRFLRRIGLGGQAAIPLILGLGCVTTATLATRALPTRRERLITVLLLSLATPCAAQLGVVLAILSFSPWALVVWAGMILAAFLVTGLVAGRGMPGPRPLLLTELPPLRRPDPGHLLRKSAARIRWYLEEILPFFLAASVVLWAMDLAGLLPSLEAALRPLARLVGLPAEASRFLLFGFFRRDYGAAGLYDLAKSGGLNIRQLMVSAVLLTLFIPCIAQLMVLKKEFGTRTTAVIVGFVFAAAFGIAAAMSVGLQALGMG